MRSLLVLIFVLLITTAANAMPMYRGDEQFYGVSNDLGDAELFYDYNGIRYGDPHGDYALRISSTGEVHILHLVVDGTAQISGLSFTNLTLSDYLRVSGETMLTGAVNAYGNMTVQGIGNFGTLQQNGVGVSLSTHNHTGVYYASGSKVSDSELLDGIDSTGFSLSGHTHSYLPLSGGTLTGTLISQGIIPSASNTYTLGASGNSYSSVFLGNMKLGDSNEWSEVNTATDNGSLYVNWRGYNSGTSYFRNFVVANGKNGALLTIIGSTGIATFANTPLVGSNSVWHAGNDGSGSGLDSDLLDGQSSAYYATASSLGSYLPLAGGTMTGDLAMGALNAGRVITFRSDMLQDTTTGVGAEDVQGNGNQDGLALYAGDGLAIRSAKGGALLALMRHTGNWGIGGTEPYSRLRIKQSTTGYLGGLDLQRSDTLDTWEMVTGGDSSLYWGYATSASGADAPTDYTERMKLTSAGVLTVNGSTVWTAGNDGSTSGLDADLLDGYSAAFSNTPNTIVGRDGNGYILATYFNQASGDETQAASHYFFMSGSDGWHRRKPIADVRSEIVTSSAVTSALAGQSVAGGAGTALTLTHTTGVPLVLQDVSQSSPTAASNYIELKTSGGTRYGWIGDGSGGSADLVMSAEDATGRVAFYTAGSIRLLISSSGVADFYSTPTAGGNTIWHAGDDGAGSGLDADLLDGISSGTFLRGDSRNTILLNGRTSAYTGSSIELQTSDGTNPGISFHTAGISATNLYEVAGQLYINPWVGGGGKIWHAGNDGSGSGLDADTIDGLHATQTAGTANSVVATNASGYLNVNYINTNVVDEASAASHYMYMTASDGYIRRKTLANVRSEIVTSAAVTGGLGYTPWYSGNDGAGSGLDADLLDGYNLTTAGTASTVALRDASGDITTRVFYANVASGTAPFIVNSTTKVTNLNAEMVDGFHASQSAGASNSLVTTNVSGYIMAYYINSNIGQDNVAASSYFYETGSDGYLRKKSLANVKTEIVTTAAVQAALAGAPSTGSIDRAACYDFADRATKFISTANTITSCVFDDASHPNVYAYNSTYGSVYDMISYSTLGMSCTVTGTPTRVAQGTNAAVTMGGAGSNIGYDFTGSTNYFSLTTGAEQHVVFLATPATAAGGYVYTVFDWNSSRRAIYITFNTTGLLVLLWDEATDGYKQWSSTTTFTAGTWYLVDVKLTSITSAGSGAVTANYSTGWSSATSASAVSFNAPTTVGTFNNVSTSLSSWPSSIGKCYTGSSDSFNGKLGFVMVCQGANMTATLLHLIYNAIVRNYYAL